MGEKKMTDNDRKFNDVMAKLETIAPGADDAPKPASHALAQIKRQLEPQQQSKWRLPTMFNRRYLWATLSLLVLLVIVVSIPGVRAAASDFLGLFRVQKFAPISISAEQIALLAEIAESGLYPGDIEMFDEPGPAVPVESADAAGEVAGWKARSPNARELADQVFVIEGGAGRLTIDVENTRALVKAAGADPGLIPDSLEGAEVNVTVYTAVSQSWQDGIMLNQSPSPLIEYPEEVDTVALGEALLQALGMDSRQARRLARSIDWTSTLLLPIPEGMATFNEVSVDGVDGLAFGSMDGSLSALLWQNDGMVYVLSGGQVDDLVAVANSMQ
jgi:hypothetical protein